MESNSKIHEFFIVWISVVMFNIHILLLPKIEAREKIDSITCTIICVLCMYVRCTATGLEKQLVTATYYIQVDYINMREQAKLYFGLNYITYDVRAYLGDKYLW